MLDAFWSGIGEELAKNWVARVLSPAFAFWVGGLALLWWNAHVGGVAARGWVTELTATGDQLAALSVLAQIGLIIGGLVLVATSAVVAERLTTPLLRLLEGYWTRPAWLRTRLVGFRRRRLARVRTRVVALQLRQRRGELNIDEYDELLNLRARRTADRTRLADLEKRAAQGFTAQEHAELNRGLGLLLTSPDTDDLGMPTRLGDVLRAAEHRPVVSYGLDGVVCWDALWLLLPEATRTELTQIRTTLDGAVRGWLWGALFLAWAPINPWAALVAIAVPWLSYRYGILPRALAFGRLVVTCYDLHRMQLYDALHLRRPRSPDEERTTAGTRVTAALSGTLVDDRLRYRFDAPTRPA